MLIFRPFLALIASVLLLPVLDATSIQRVSALKPLRAIAAPQFSVDQLHVIVRPESDSKNLDAALADFIDLFESRFFRKLDLVTEGSPKQSIDFELTDRSPLGGGFSIWTDRTKVTIRAGDAEGWVNALYAIMHDLMGARWYWSGELGFEWVPPSKPHFPNGPWVEQPAFVQRQLYPADGEFGRRNRLNRVYSFNHNLAKIFNPELFEAQPELFASQKGRRIKPTGSGTYDPQPDFTQPEAVEIAVEAALNHFKAKPESTSFSLSINDNTHFDTQAATEAAIRPLSYFRARPNYTDLVFGFMNKVARRVFDEAGLWETPSGEPRYLTALAYAWTEAAPSFPLHPRVMPVLTSDRAQWHDPAYREEDKALILKWTDSGAERIATWDYYFGAPYLYPRQFNQWIAESLPFMAEAGIDVFFSQLPSFWGLDGAKAWLSAELLWDPDQDAEALLAEYYTNFFATAAGPMRRFYEIAEQHRNTHEGAADWIKLYRDESGIALFSFEVLEQMRRELDQAEAQAVHESRQRLRVEAVSRAFELTERYALYDTARRELVERCFLPDTQARIRAQLETYRVARDAYQSYLKGYLQTDTYAPARRSIASLQSEPEGLARAALDPEPEAPFVSLVDGPDLRHLSLRALDFLGPVLPQLEGWWIDYRPSEHFRVYPSSSAEAAAGLRIEGADGTTVYKVFRVESGEEYEYQARVAWKASLGNRVHVHLIWSDEEGRTLKSEIPLRLPLGEFSEPKDVRIPLIAPEGATTVRIRNAVSRQAPGDYVDFSWLDFGFR